jgi:hypothetical protein
VADQPTWVLELVEAVADYESKHGHPDVGWTCLAAALERVPADVCAEARGYGRAKREAKPVDLGNPLGWSPEQIRAAEERSVEAEKQMGLTDG